MADPSMIDASGFLHGRHRICVVGADSWGTVIGRIAAERAVELPRTFVRDVKIWLKDEKCADGAMLAETINKRHENVKYLPGVKLPENLIAEPELEKAAWECTLLLFAVPMEQIHAGLFARILAGCSANCRVLSLVKGMSFTAHMLRDEHGMHNGERIPTLVSQQIRKEMHGASVSVLMGGNIATEVASGEFCEATIGARDVETGEVWYRLLNSPMFRLNVILDVEGVEVCGSLKGLVALAAGFSDGLGYRSNTKAAITRIGLDELRR